MNHALMIIICSIRRFSLVVFACAMAMSSAVLQAEVIPVDNNDPVLTITGAQVSYVRAPPPAWNPEAALSAGQWQVMDGPINFGYTHDAFWYRFILENTTQKPLERYLEVSYPMLDRLEFYQWHAGQEVARYQTGDHLPYHQRPLKHRTFVFPVSLGAGEKHTIGLRVQTSGAQNVPLKLWQPRAFIQANEVDLVGRSMFYGMLLAMAIFNLFLYAYMRETSFLVFFAVQLCLLIAVASLHGTMFAYLVPAAPQVHELLVLTSVPLTGLFFCLFCINFLGLKQKFRAGYHPLRISVGIFLLAGLGGFILPYGLSTRLSIGLLLLACPVILWVGAVLAWRGDRSGRWFISAWLVLLLAATGLILDLVGVFSSELIQNFGVEVGAIMTSLVFSFALGERFHRERKALTEEQQARIRVMREHEAVEHKFLESVRFHHLTGLPNRPLLEQCLTQQIQAVEGSEDCIALVLLHLQGFDDINKTLGHHNADQFLQRLATRLNQQVRELPYRVIVAEGNGETFAAAHVEGITFGCVFRVPGLEIAQSLVQPLARAVQLPIRIHGLDLSIRVVGGCAVCPDHSKDAQTLLRQAFIAFDHYDTETGLIAFFRATADGYTERRLTLMTALQEAIENDCLTLYFQPQVRIVSGEVTGFEALVRWTNPDHGVVDPEEFIPMAERAGLMQDLTDRVLDRALDFAYRLESVGHYLTISVNISVVNLLDPEFPASVAKKLEKHRLEPHKLVLEVTETAAMKDPERALQALRSLHDAGIRLSIDDFGTGYSSLTYIRRLPLDEIKIDRSFVADINRNTDDGIIVRATINMCHALGYQVVAEGVESAAALKELSMLHCDYAQGYHVSRPMPETAALEWLQQKTAKNPA